MKTITSFNKNTLLEAGRCSVGILKQNENIGFELGCITELFIKKINSGGAWYQGEFIELELFHDRSVAKITGRLLEFDMLVINDANCLNQANARNLLRSLSLYNQAGGRLVALGDGILVLAEAGLLNGKVVPTVSIDPNAAIKYPQVTFSAELTYSKGPQIYCASCGFNVLELCLFIIGKDLGMDAVRMVVSELNLSVVMINSVEQQLNKLYCKNGDTLCPQESRISLAVRWASDNIRLVDNVDQLAERAYLSRRSFDRQFRAVMGLSAKDWLTQQRLTLAKKHLKNSQLSIEEIAAATGFGNSNNFRNNFVKSIGISPSSFRLSAYHGE